MTNETAIQTTDITGFPGKPFATSTIGKILTGATCYGYTTFQHNGDQFIIRANRGDDNWFEIRQLAQIIHTESDHMTFTGPTATINNKQRLAPQTRYAEATISSGDINTGTMTLIECAKAIEIYLNQCNFA
jgi:hypothetical protein